MQLCVPVVVDVHQVLVSLSGFFQNDSEMPLEQLQIIKYMLEISNVSMSAKDVNILIRNITNIQYRNFRTNCLVVQNYAFS